MREGLVDLEVAMSSGAACMDDALGDPLVIEMRDLLAQDEIFEERRSPHPALERVLVVRDGRALVRREYRFDRAGRLVELASPASDAGRARLGDGGWRGPRACLAGGGSGFLPRISGWLLHEV